MKQNWPPIECPNYLTSLWFLDSATWVAVATTRGPVPARTLGRHRWDHASHPCMNHLPMIRVTPCTCRAVPAGTPIPTGEPLVSNPIPPDLFFSISIYVVFNSMVAFRNHFETFHLMVFLKVSKVHRHCIYSRYFSRHFCQAKWLARCVTTASFVSPRVNMSGVWCFGHVGTCPLLISPGIDHTSHCRRVFVVSNMLIVLFYLFIFFHFFSFFALFRFAYCITH